MALQTDNDNVAGSFEPMDDVVRDAANAEVVSQPGQLGLYKMYNIEPNQRVYLMNAFLFYYVDGSLDNAQLLAKMHSGGSVEPSLSTRRLTNINGVAQDVNEVVTSCVATDEDLLVIIDGLVRHYGDWFTRNRLQPSRQALYQRLVEEWFREITSLKTLPKSEMLRVAMAISTHMSQSGGQ